jgi:hypothetical protein
MEQTVPYDLMTVLATIATDLGGLRAAVEDLANNSEAAVAPDYRYPMAAYWTFDWAVINARVVDRDNDGPTAVQYRNRVYYRRSPRNKFAPAVWYSYADGQDDTGNTVYRCLVTFKDVADVDPVPDKIRDLRPAPAAAPTHSDVTARGRSPEAVPPTTRTPPAAAAPVQASEEDPDAEARREFEAIPGARETRAAAAAAPAAASAAAPATAAKAASYRDWPRPLTPLQVEIVVRSVAEWAALHTAEAAFDPGAWKALLGAMERTGDREHGTEQRHTFYKRLFDVTSSADLSDARKFGLIRWSQMARNANGSWAPGQHFAEEYRRVLADADLPF